MPYPSSSGDEALERVLGVRGLAATTFNVMIGGGIFVIPAIVAGQQGTRAPLAYVVCAAAMGLIVLCFAEAGSRVSLTGGPYAYVDVAFGPFVGFLAGVLLWVITLFATSAVAGALASAVGALWPVLASPAARWLLLAVLFTTLAAVNVRGAHGGARLVELVTVVKLLPLMLLVAAGAFIAPSAASAPATGTDTLGRTVVVLVFAFAGVESALVPSGEVRDPARTVPRALAIAMIAVTALYVGIQWVAQRALGVPALAAAADAPLVAVARRIAGAPGALVLAAATVISMFGHLSGMTLATPRALYAFGRDGFIPFVSARLASIHPRHRTPHVAIIVHCAIAAVLAASNGFVRLAILANVAVLTLYFACCAATLELRRRDIRSGGVPFRVPGGPVVPVLALAVIIWILASARLVELGVVAGVVAAAALLFFVTAPSRRQLRTASPP